MFWKITTQYDFVCWNPLGVSFCPAQLSSWGLFPLQQRNVWQGVWRFPQCLGSQRITRKFTVIRVQLDRFWLSVHWAEIMLASTLVMGLNWHTVPGYYMSIYNIIIYYTIIHLYIISIYMYISILMCKLYTLRTKTRGNPRVWKTPVVLCSFLTKPRVCLPFLKVPVRYIWIHLDSG